MAGPRVGRAEAVSARLLRLEARLSRAERQLRAALALRGRLQALERRLDNGGGAAPRVAARRGGREAARPRSRRVPVRLEDVWVQFGEREWRALRGWQRALHRAVLRSSCPSPLPLGKGPEPPGPRGRQVGERRVPEVPPPGPAVAPHLPPPAEAGAARRQDARARWEDGDQSCEDGDGRGDPADSGEPADSGSEDSLIHIKQEDELCTAEQREEEAGEAPGEPCPEHMFYDAEVPSQPQPGREAAELPGTGGQDPPGATDSGFRAYAADVLSWIKQEENPRDLPGRDISADTSAAHDGAGKRDLPADSFESTACDSDVPGRPGEKFPKDPSPGMTWEGQWNSEMMEAATPGSGLACDARYDRGFGEHLDFLGAQENTGKRPGALSKCEGISSQQEQLQPPQGARQGDPFPGPACEKSLGERVFHLLPPQPRVMAERDEGLGADHGYPLQHGHPSQHNQHPQQGHLPQHNQHPQHGLGGEEQPALESEENFPVENPLSSPCWDHPPERPEGCGQCPQHLAPRGSPPNQQPGQGRGKSYICSDCGKSFICHSWLVRHQMTHTGERPYKCSECDKSYRRKDYLLNHQRRHSGEGLFQCPLCRKRFVLRRSFVKHQESHVQETHLTLAGWPCADIRGSVMHSI